MSNNNLEIHYRHYGNIEKRCSFIFTQPTLRTINYTAVIRREFDYATGLEELIHSTHARCF